MEQFYRYKYVGIQQQKQRKIKAIDVILAHMRRKNSVIIEHSSLNKLAEEVQRKTIFDPDPDYVAINILEEKTKSITGLVNVRDQNKARLENKVGKLFG
jgi:thiamine biosynthesis lipoprotein ApbE